MDMIYSFILKPDIECHHLVQPFQTSLWESNISSLRHYRINTCYWIIFFIFFNHSLQVILCIILCWKVYFTVWLSSAYESHLEESFPKTVILIFKNLYRCFPMLRVLWVNEKHYISSASNSLYIYFLWFNFYYFKFRYSNMNTVNGTY